MLAMTELWLLTLRATVGFLSKPHASVFFFFLVVASVIVLTLLIVCAACLGMWIRWGLYTSIPDRPYAKVAAVKSLLMISAHACSCIVPWIRF